MTIPILDKLAEYKARKRELQKLKDEFAISVGFQMILKRHYEDLMQAYSDSQNLFIKKMSTADAHALARMQSATMREFNRQLDNQIEHAWNRKKIADSYYEHICLRPGIKKDLNTFKYALVNYKRVLELLNDSIDKAQQYIEQRNRFIDVMQGGNYEYQDQ